MIAAETLGASTPREWAAFDRAGEWINSPRLTAASLQGKVVLVQFWTYTCINWLRTLPYFRAWSEKYRGRVVTIGVHTPEFPFEHDLENVRRAVRQMKVDYPVVVDNDYDIWRAFDNHYWPALYLLDPQGRVRHHQFGEGAYDTSELAIQRALADANLGVAGEGIVSVQPSGVELQADWGDLRSAETYLRPNDDEVLRRSWTLSGKWSTGNHAVASTAPSARIVNRFHARDLHLVMGPARAGQTVPFRVTLDGQPPGAAHGLDIDGSGNGTVVEPRMYQLIRQPKPIVDRRFEIEFLDSGVEAFSFTFG